jgi:hypothetical protein
MNLAYLGDALDYWKGALFEFLAARHLLHEFAVDPMASDLASWRATDYALFAELLRVRPEQIIRHRARLTTPQQYFDEIHHRGDLFVDPDTGIATCRVLDREKYVRPEDVQSLLSVGRNRLVVVYQHVRARKVATRVDEVVACVAGSVSLAWCSYESGTVAMLFLSLAERRTQNIATALREKLGRHAARRVRQGVMNR